MKPIEQFAQETAKKQEYGIMEQPVYDAVMDTYKFLNQWYTFDEEIPQHKVKVQTKDIHGEIITFRFTGSCNIKDSAKAMSFTHWRPIYE